jgi:hypothetical protein
LLVCWKGAPMGSGVGVNHHTFSGFALCMELGARLRGSLRHRPEYAVEKQALDACR